MDRADATTTGHLFGADRGTPAAYRWVTPLLVGGAVGLVAGMACFVYIKFPLAPGWVAKWWALGLIVLAGAFVPFLSADLDRGVMVAVIGLSVALLVHAVAWVLPLLTLNYDPIARDLLLPVYLGRAVLSYILVVPLAFMGGYLAGVLFDGVLLE